MGSKLLPLALLVILACSIPAQGISGVPCPCCDALMKRLLMNSPTAAWRGMLCCGTGAQQNRQLLHWDEHHDGGGGSSNGNDCVCKHADWYCYGYCNIGTDYGVVSICIHDCLVCCGWAKVSVSLCEGTPNTAQCFAQ